MMQTLRKNLSQLLIGGMFAVLVLLALIWFRQLMPAEVAIVGSWITPVQPDGFATEMRLRSDRTCRVRWLNAKGQEMPLSRPAREGRWQVEGGSLVVDTRIKSHPLAVLFPKKMAPKPWSFAIGQETLTFTSMTSNPLVLNRQIARQQ